MIILNQKLKSYTHDVPSPRRQIYPSGEPASPAAPYPALSLASTRALQRSALSALAGLSGPTIEESLPFRHNRQSDNDDWPT